MSFVDSDGKDNSWRLAHRQQIFE